MHKELLSLKPKRYLCPACGEWHDWEEGALSECTIFGPAPSDKTHVDCSNTDCRFFVEEDFYIHVNVINLCSCRCFEEAIPFDSICEDSTRPIITFDVDVDGAPIYFEDFQTPDCNCDCSSVKTCNVYRLGHQAKRNSNGDYTLKFTFGFEFDEEDYWKIVNPRKLLPKEPESITPIKQQEQKTQVVKTSASKQKEETTMNNNVTRIFDQLYKHSPQENVQLLMQWGEKYKPALKWAVPLLSVYAAYRILNSKSSGITADNIEQVCEKHLGFPMEALTDKANLRKLMQFGKVAAIGYGAMKVFSSIYGSKEPKAISAQEVENGLQEITAMSKKYGWISPMTEKLLPIALCVIVVYVISAKPTQISALTDKVKAKASGIVDGAKIYAEMAQLFIADKFHIDLSNEEEKQKAKKFAFLAAIVFIGVLLYGKKMLASSKGNDDTAENIGMKAFMDQILGIMKKLMPVAFAGATTWLVAKKLIPAPEENMLFSGEGEVFPDEHPSPEDV